MVENQKQRVKDFDEGVKSVVEANEANVSPDTRSEGALTLVLFAAVACSIIFFFIGLFYDPSYYWLSGGCVVVYTLIAIKMGNTAWRQLTELKEHRTEMILQRRKDYCKEDDNSDAS